MVMDNQLYLDLPIIITSLRLIPEEGVAGSAPSKVKKLIFCTGKVYYDLTAARKEANLEDTVAIARIEQVCSEYYYCYIYS